MKREPALPSASSLPLHITCRLLPVGGAQSAVERGCRERERGREREGENERDRSETFLDGCWLNVEKVSKIQKFGSQFSTVCATEVQTGRRRLQHPPKSFGSGKTQSQSCFFLHVSEGGEAAI